MSPPSHLNQVKALMLATKTTVVDDDDYLYDSMYGYGVYPGSKTKQWGTKPSTPHNSAYGRTYVHTVEKVAVVSADGTEDRYTIPYDGRGWFAIASTIWPTVDNVMRVPLEHCSFTYTDPPFNACVFTAANDYLQARWGRKMDITDQRWLAQHPYSTDGGVPQEYTATCVHQLVAPYGMVVSRVRLRRGSVVLGDAVMSWLNSLGCNPFAMADRSTTNAEAAEKLGMTPAEADAIWRVEFHDDPLPGSIVGERGWSNAAAGASGVVTGNFGGHARYVAPRGNAGDWFISVQLAPDDRVEYLVPAPNPEYVPRKGVPSLLYTSVTDLNGDPVAVKEGGTWKRPGAPPAASPVLVPAQVPAPTRVTAPAPPPTESRIHGHLVMCDLCGEDVRTQDMLREAEVCYDCAETLWDGIVCPHCDISLGRSVPYPMTYSLHDDGRVKDYEYCCNSCRETITVGALTIEEQVDTHDVLFEQYHELMFGLESLTEQLQEDTDSALDFPA